MRNFMRSTPVKVTLFTVYALSVMLLILSVTAVSNLSMEGFYGKTQKAVTEERIEAELPDDLEYYAEAVKDVFYTDGADENPDYSRGIEQFSSEGTNLRLAVYDSNGRTMAKNTDESFSVNASVWRYTFYFTVDTAYRQEFFNDEVYVVGYIGEVPHTHNMEGDVYTVKCYITSELAENDRYLAITEQVNKIYPYRNYPVVSLAVSAVLSVITLVSLILLAGRRPNSDELHPGRLYRLPFDALIAAMAAAVALVLYILDPIFWWGGDIISVLVIFWLLSMLFCGLTVSVSARIKGGTLIKNTVIYRAARLILRLARAAAVRARLIYSGLPLIWRTAVALLLYLAAEGLFILIFCGALEAGTVVILWIAQKVVFIPLALLTAVYLRRLEAGGRAIAEGDLGYHIDTSLMYGPVKTHGENLNSIADGMAAAVERRMQSERMKTDLITNVSHDIKTPLTSIINYSNLIAEKECDCPEHKEYADVLLRKSESLRRLLEDVVEVSKASSGNLDVSLEACDAGVLLAQAAGEFESRCHEAGLELVTSSPEAPVEIMADSRRIWRVFDNLLGNAVKYSLPGSRVYLALTADGEKAVFTFRNTSKAQLNISPTELIERFVRGDSARTGEGNGLGLSIAQSLTELQNGRMELSIDGDLFKVTLTFPQITK